MTSEQGPAGSYAEAAASFSDEISHTQGDQEEDWVEVEIERLLHGGGEIRETLTYVGFVCMRISTHLQTFFYFVQSHTNDHCQNESIDSLFATYLSTVGSLQADMQALLFDAYSNTSTADGTN